MAKKKIQPRRVPRSAEPRMFGDGKPSSQAAQPGTQAVSTNGNTATATAAKPGGSQPLRAGVTPARAPVTVTTDYSYVKKDLRRLGITAAGIFAVLIALGLLIR